MSERYCPKCQTDVEDVGGFCLLGHDLRLRPAAESMGDLRAEVDRAFEHARVQVAAITGEIPGVSTPPPPPPPPLPEDLEQRTKARMEELWADYEEEKPSPSDPITQFAPNTRMDWGPGDKPKRRGFRRS
jgi:hypothetical protein